MLRKIVAVSCVFGLALSSAGCVAVAAGAGGAVLWQSGKVVSEETASVQRAVASTKSVFKSHHILLTDEVTKKEVTQLRGEDPGHVKVAVDLFETGSKTVRIEVRMGMGDKTAARELLADIKKQLQSIF